MNIRSTKSRRFALRGFSLVEVVVVSGIAVTLFTVILAMQFTAGQTRVFTQERDIAREAAITKLEEISASSYPNLVGTYTDDQFPVNGLVSSVAGETVGIVRLDRTVAPASAELTRVTVQMRWRSKASGGAATTFELSTLLADRELN